VRSRSLIAGLTLLASVAGAQSSYAAVVLFDNFNSDPQQLNWAGDSTFTSTAPPGSTDLIGTGFYDFYPGNGNYVDMDGSTGSGNNPAGQLTSNASFGPGNYTLSFMLGGNARGAPAQTTDIQLGSFLQSITLNSGDPLALYTFAFGTTGGQLLFTELGPSDQQGNILDNVSLAVPEPSTWAMLLLGFGGLGMMYGRTSRKAALA
jgi:hypothetical protein